MAKKKNQPRGIVFLQVFHILHIVGLLVLFFISYNNVAGQNFVVGKSGFQIGMNKEAALSYTWPLLFVSIVTLGISIVMLIKFYNKNSLGLLRLLSIFYVIPVLIWLFSNATVSEVPYFSENWQWYSLLAYTIGFSLVSTVYLLKARAVDSYYLRVH